MTQDAIERLRVALLSHPKALSSAAAALWARAGRALSVEDLQWASGLGRTDAPNLVWEGLLEVGAMRNGILEPVGVQRFLAELFHDNFSEATAPPVRVVWTLPSGHPAARLRGQSLLAAALQLVDQAKHSLTITSPYIEARGVGMLLDPLVRAVDRGVHVTVLGSNLVNIGSAESRALEDLRRASEGRFGRLDIYSSVSASDAPRDEHPLLHAKLIISDERAALVSSANMTIYGQTSNFEVGACLEGGEVPELSTILRSLLESPLVTHIASVNP